MMRTAGAAGRETVVRRRMLGLIVESAGPRVKRAIRVFCELRKPKRKVKGPAKPAGPLNEIAFLA